MSKRDERLLSAFCTVFSRTALIKGLRVFLNPNNAFCKVDNILHIAQHVNQESLK